MDISVIIINYNTADLIKQCVTSILNQTGVTYEIIVADNASTDDSVNVLKTFGESITLIANKDNLGFGKANNRAFKKSKGRYLFLLNPDAELMGQDALYKAVKYMEEYPECGLAGTQIINNNNQIEKTYYDHYPREDQSSIDFSKLPGKLATVLGASMVIRRDVFEAVNGFDEDFFLYAEETDLCLRIRKYGYQIQYNDSAVVKHIGSASTRKSPPEHVIRMKKHAKYLFYKKHYSKHDVIKMAKKDLSHARWHLLRLKFKKIIRGLKISDELKYMQHKVTMQLVKEFLVTI